MSTDDDLRHLKGAMDQLVDQVAHLALGLKRVEDRLAVLAEQQRPGAGRVDNAVLVSHPAYRAHTCTCSAGYVLDEEGWAHRCPDCHPIPDAVPPN